MATYFIKCKSPSYMPTALYVIKDNKPHRLNHPKSLDRDWFKNERDAAKAKRRLEKLYANWPITFAIERH